MHKRMIRPRLSWGVKESAAFPRHEALRRDPLNRLGGNQTSTFAALGKSPAQGEMEFRDVHFLPGVGFRARWDPAEVMQKRAARMDLVLHSPRNLAGIPTPAPPIRLHQGGQTTNFADATCPTHSGRLAQLVRAPR